VRSPPLPFSHSGRGWEDGLRFHDALRAVWDQVRALNREIEEARPWDLLKHGDRTRHLSTCRVKMEYQAGTAQAIMKP
jgi:methionyl-tRNA synthetase